MWNGILALLRVKMCKYVWFAAARRGVSGEEVDAEDHTATRDGDEAVPLPTEEGLPEEQRLHQKGHYHIIFKPVQHSRSVTTKFQWRLSNQLRQNESCDITHHGALTLAETDTDTQYNKNDFRGTNAIGYCSHFIGLYPGISLGLYYGVFTLAVSGARTGHLKAIEI